MLKSLDYIRESRIVIDGYIAYKECIAPYEVLEVGVYLCTLRNINVKMFTDGDNVGVNFYTMFIELCTHVPILVHTYEGYINTSCDLGVNYRAKHFPVIIDSKSSLVIKRY